MSLSREVTKVSLFLCSALRVNSVFTLCKCVSHVRGATAYVTPLSPPASALHGRFREGSPELGLLPRLPRSRTTVRVSLSAACSRSALSCVGRRLVGPLLRSCVSSASGVGAAGLVQSCCRSPAPTGSMHARGSSLLAQKSAPLPGGCTRGGADGRGASARGVVKHAGGPIIRAARTTRRREAMSRRPFCIVCSIKPHAFPIPSFSPSSLAHFQLCVKGRDGCSTAIHPVADGCAGPASAKLCGLRRPYGPQQDRRPH